MQSHPGRYLHSRPISGLHSFTDLIALAIVRLSISPRQGITGHSTLSSLGLSTTDRHQGVLRK